MPSGPAGAEETMTGTSLSIILALVIAAFLVARRRRRGAMKEPPSLGPPLIATEVDRFIADEAGQLLDAGEVIQHQAYVQDGRLFDSWAHFAVLTDRRLLLIRTPEVGSPRCESHGVEEIDRADILGAVAEHWQYGMHSFALFLRDGSTRRFNVRGRDRALSNQKRFLRDVPRLLVTDPSLASKPASTPTTFGRRRDDLGARSLATRRPEMGLG